MPQISAKFDDALLARIGATSPADFEAKLTALLDAQPGKLAAAKAEGEAAGAAAVTALASRCDAFDARIKVIEAKPAVTFDASEVTKTATAAASLKVAEIIAANGGKPLTAATLPANDSTNTGDKASDPKVRYAADAGLQAEFPSAEAYIGFCKLEEQGRVRISSNRK